MYNMQMLTNIQSYMLRVNAHYSEKALWVFTDDLCAHLALQMEWGQFSDGCNISISPEGINYSAFEEDEMNTVRKVLTLLVVAVSEYDDTYLLEKNIVTLPEDCVATWVDSNKWWDLFKEIPLTAKSYCLYRAYHLLSDKLSQRNTSLFRVLYICTCLELWRQKVSPEMIVWPIGHDVHWWSLILRLTGNFSRNSLLDFNYQGFGNFVYFLLCEVKKLSQEDIPEIIIQSIYSRNGIQTPGQIHNVRDYLGRIMAESRKK